MRGIVSNFAIKVGFALAIAFILVATVIAQTKIEPTQLKGVTGVTSTAPGGFIVAGPVSGSSQALCTDASGSLTVTTSACPALVTPAPQFESPYYCSPGNANILCGLLPTAGYDGVPQIQTEVTVVGTTVLPVLQPAGVLPRASVCPSNLDTVLLTDRMKYVTWSDAGACAVTLPQVGGTGFGANFAFVACDIGSGTATVTPTVSTISYSSAAGYTSGAASMPLTTGQCAFIYSDSSNYFAITISSGVVGPGTTGHYSAFQTSSKIGNGTLQEGSSPSTVSASTSTFPARIDLVNYADAFTWSQTSSSPVSLVAGSNVITLAPCPFGLSATYLVDAAPESSPNFYVDVSVTGTPETVPVTATTCTPGAASGTITITTANTHAAGYVVGSSTSGWQEAINDCELRAAPSGASNCLISGKVTTNNTGAHLLNDVNLDAPLVTHGAEIILDGKATRFACNHPQQCIVLGDRNPGSLTFHHNTLANIRLYPNWNGTLPQVNLIQSVTQAGAPGVCTYTVTFTGNHDFVMKYPWIYVGGSLNNNTLAGIRQITAIPAANQIQFKTQTCVSWTTPVALTVYSGGYAIVDYSGIEDDLANDGFFNNVLFDSLQFPNTANIWHWAVVDTTDEHTVFHEVSFFANLIRASTSEADFSNILAPGPSGQVSASAAAILKITDSELQGGTNHNLIDWWSGNDLNIENSLLQDWGHFAVRMMRRRGGFGGFTSTGDHWENGGSPTASTAALISAAFGTTKVQDAQPPLGSMPKFGITIGDGLTRWIYYVQPKSSTADTLCATQTNDNRCVAWNGGVTNLGNGPVLPAGYALVDSGTGGTVAVSWPAIRDATSYSLYRIATSSVNAVGGLTAPFGTGNFLIQASINPLVSCTDTTCTLTDSIGLTPSNVTVPTYGDSSFAPFLDYWPGSVVLTAATTVSTNSFAGPLAYNGDPVTQLVTESLPGVSGVKFNAPVIVNNTNWFQPYAFEMDGVPGARNGVLPTPAKMFPFETASIPQADGGAVQNRKGVINFGTIVTPTYPFDIMTFWDSNFVKTINTVGRRPSNDAADCAPGFDQANGLSFRCNTSISNYIGTLNDNSSFSERLTATLKTFNVPIQQKCVSLASLGAAAAGNKGTQACISDSTAVAAEGQTCVGSNSNTALAFSNGTVWKCF